MWEAIEENARAEESAFQTGQIIGFLYSALAAGTINHAAGSTGAFALGADTGGTSTTTFNMSGGKLIESVSISGSQGAGAKQAFVWTGGTLATFAYTATNLTSSAGTAVNLGVTNTLANGGGTLAPGDIGIVGKTLITGRYNVTSPNAALAIDIGGTTASALFQETAGSGKFDNIQTNGAQGTASLDGKLNVALVDSFTPSNANTFKIVNTIASGLSGTFNNTAAGSTTAGGGVRVALADGLSSFKVTYNTADVTLGSYLASNEWSAASGSNWSTANDWSAFTPSLAGHIAKFADTPSAGAVAVNLDANQTVAGLQFNSTTRNYTISSGNSSGLTLDNNGSSSAITVAGTHSLNVPVALNNNLSVTTTGSGDSLSVGGAIGGSGKTLTKTGSGTLSLSGANTYSGATTVSAGTLLVSAGDINSSAVTVEIGAKLAYNSGTARTNSITLNGNGMLSRATLSGTGTISTALVLDNIGDTLSPGNSPGIQNFGTSQSWNAFTYVWELNSFTGTTAGTAFDRITITGGLALTGASGAYLLDITSLLGDNTPGNVPNFSEVNRSWTILTTTTGITGFNAANWTMGTTAFSSSPTAAGTWALTKAGNDLVLSYAVPEPATWALLAFSLTTVMVLRRRRNS